MKASDILDHLLLALPTIHDRHAPGSELYMLLKQVARKEVKHLFSNADSESRRMGQFGGLIFPFHRMGKTVDSTNLFDLDELIFFAFYWTNRARYRRVLDAGANLGLHSIMLCKCGFEVRSYEPDTQHFSLLQRNLDLNHCTHAKAYNAAISSTDRQMEFIKVVGNTTASHIAGAKMDPYGELETYTVQVEAIHPLLEWADLVKLDIEGHEKDVLLSTAREHWMHTDALIEIENEENARAVYAHLRSVGVSMFAQKVNWQAVEDVGDVPTNYREGSLFLTCQNEMPWR